MQYTGLARILLSLPLLAAINACHSVPGKPADSRQWIAISCSTFLQPGNTCVQEALAICPQGYDIYNPQYFPGEQRRKLEIACR